MTARAPASSASDPMSLGSLTISAPSAIDPALLVAAIRARFGRGRVSGAEGAVAEEIAEAVRAQWTSSGRTADGRELEGERA